MSVVTIARLCRDLDGGLVPRYPRQAPETVISAVHVSELPDPTIYLDGAELLLTTGMALDDDAGSCREYVDRLVHGGVAALGLGVGIVHRSAPPPLVDACRNAGLCLLEVPERTPFLAISKAFWSAESQAGTRELTAAVGAHRAIVAAAAGNDPAGGVLKALSTALDGWAVLLDAAGDVRQVWPQRSEHYGQVLRAESRRLKVAGLHSSATFPVDGHDTVIHPLVAGDRVHGYLAAGLASPMTPRQRHFVLTACALLGLDLDRRHRRDAWELATRAAVARLLDLGHARPAGDLARRSGVPEPDGPVRVLVVDGIDEELAIRRVMDTWAGAEVFGVNDTVGTWAVIAGADPVPDLAHLGEALRGINRDVRALLGPPGDVGDIPVHRAWLAAELCRRRRGQVAEIDNDPSRPDVLDAARAGLLIRPLLDLGREEVVTAVAAYLRHHGQWESAARDLGVHRNTLRYRVKTAEDALGQSLRDPDTAAMTWLALRATRRA